MKNIFRISAKIDLWLIIIGILLSIIGVLFIYSSNINKDHFKYIKQIISLVLGIIVYIIFATYDYKRLTEKWFFLYIAGIILLILTLIIGTKINNSKSWIKIAGFSFQTSELCKIFFIISLTSFIDKFKDNVKSFSFIIVSLLLLLPYIGLIIFQPDLGTVIVFILITFIMLFIAGIKLLYIGTLFFIAFIAIVFSFTSYVFDFYNINNIFSNILRNQVVLSIAGIILIASGFITMIIYIITPFQSKRVFYTYIVLLSMGFGLFISVPMKNFFKDYHYKRLIVLIDPEIDPLGKGYNIRQSVISIGAGKFLGQGFTSGKQNRGNFLPSEDTDFIISVIAEETGFLGVSIVILLLFFLVYKSLHIAFSARDFIGYMLAGGLSAMYISHILINLFSATGLFPVIGIPLPFISYGGSSLITNFIALGILFNIESKKFTYITK
ncbi:MAG TPA: rod shape-determining protein RodA [Spirochaetota bacterium]|nr:rod shape-determining protein RodA [Spirochaetota bacterium]HOM38382.1 rod shape-determining protein RodA [Spirochaetota bacterium]HPQ48400.1 rod shape-determining protein RodA [Spirochaetota bacterium]